MSKWELTQFCEIDDRAIKSYLAIHNENKEKNIGDISKVKESEVLDCDLVTFGFPCTQISVAGTQQGFYNEDGSKTASGMYFEGLRLISAKKPKFVIIENVKNLVSQKFYLEFNQIMTDMQSIGYTTYWQVLNAKDYGIPQTRERVFIVCIRDDIDTMEYKFPETIGCTKVLKDFLEEEDTVEEKHYYNTPYVKEILKNVIYYKEEDKDYKQYWGYIEEIPKGCKLTRVEKAITETIKAEGMKVPRLLLLWNRYAGDIDIAHTLTTQVNLNMRASQGLIIKDKKTNTLKIRRYTPLECYRLMGFTDADFKLAKSTGASDVSLYKQAGNSIVTSLPYYILHSLYKLYPKDFEYLKVLSLCSGIGAFEKGLDKFYKDINKGKDV